VKFLKQVKNKISKISKKGIEETMISVLNVEKNDKVRRKVISALGEYLFYAAT